MEGKAQSPKPKDMAQFHDLKVVGEVETPRRSPHQEPNAVRKKPCVLPSHRRGHITWPTVRRDHQHKGCLDSESVQVFPHLVNPFPWQKHNVGEEGLRPNPARRELANAPGERCNRGPSPPSRRQPAKHGPRRYWVSWSLTRLRIIEGEKTLRSHLVSENQQQVNIQLGTNNGPRESLSAREGTKIDDIEINLLAFVH